MHAPAIWAHCKDKSRSAIVEARAARTAGQPPLAVTGTLDTCAPITSAACSHRLTLDESPSSRSTAASTSGGNSVWPPVWGRSSVTRFLAFSATMGDAHARPSISPFARATNWTSLFSTSAKPL